MAKVPGTVTDPLETSLDEKAPKQWKEEKATKSPELAPDTVTTEEVR